MSVSYFFQLCDKNLITTLTKREGVRVPCTTKRNKNLNDSTVETSIVKTNNNDMVQNNNNKELTNETSNMKTDQTIDNNNIEILNNEINDQLQSNNKKHIGNENPTSKNNNKEHSAF